MKHELESIQFILEQYLKCSSSSRRADVLGTNVPNAGASINKGTSINIFEGSRNIQGEWITN